MPVPRALAPLRHRPFALLWGGAFLSNIGTWMEAITVGIYVQETTGQAGWTGFVAGAAFIPNALLGPIGGALADRLPRRALLLTTNSIQALLAGLLAVLVANGSPSPAIIALIMFGAGCIGAAQFPAYQSILPDLVPVEDVPGAVALTSTQWNLGRVIGPALAGVAIALGGYGWALGINTASFFAPLTVIAIIPIPLPASTAGESLLRAMRAGITFARRDPGLRVAIRFLAFAAFFAAPFIALVPAFSDEVLHAELTQHGTAWLVTAQGLGAVVAGLLLGGYTERFGVRRLLLALMAALPVTLVLYALAPNLYLAVPAIFLVGLVYLGVLASSTTIAQLRAPAAMRGRVLSLFLVVLGFLYPVGAAVQGRIGDAVGLRVVTAGTAAIYAAVVFGAWIRDRHFLDPLDVPPDLGAPAHGEGVLGVVPTAGETPVGEPGKDRAARLPDDTDPTVPVAGAVHPGPEEP